MAVTGSVDKAIEILFHLSTAPSGVGLSALGRALGMPRSSAHRLLATLGRRGLVERDERGRYRPGIGLVALGLGVLEREPVVLAAREELDREAAESGETVFLVGERAGELRVLAKAEGTSFLRAAPQVGSPVPVHATAVGKLQLAFGEAPRPPSAASLVAFTPRTAVSRQALGREVEQARRRGFAENREEWIPGMAVVAAPVLARGRLQGSLALAAPTPRLEQLGAGAVARRLLEAARRTAERLEGRAP